VIRIDQAVLADVEAAARRAYPDEACGLLIGTGTHLSRAVETANLAWKRGESRDHFEVDARMHLRLQRELRGTGETIAGIFHSHPRGFPEPSQTDRREAAYPGWVWLITAIDRHGICNTRAFIDRGSGQFENCKLDIE